MKTGILALVCALALGASAFASSEVMPTNYSLQEQARLLEGAVDSMSDVELQNAMLEQADRIEAHVETLKVKGVELTPESRETLLALADQMRASAYDPELRPKLHSNIKASATVVLRIFGHLGNTVTDIVYAPGYIVSGFLTGLISGKRSDAPEQPKAWVYVVAILGGAIPTYVGEGFLIQKYIPMNTALAVLIPAALIKIAVDNACGIDKNPGPKAATFCRNVAIVNEFFGKGLFQFSQDGGARIYKFFKDLFSRDRGDKPIPEPHPVLAP